MRERVIEAELVRRVQALGGLCLKTVVLGQRGWPDRLCILPGGIVMLVETKRPHGGRLSEHQKQFRDKLAALGIAVAIVRNSEDIGQLVQQASVKRRGPRR